jgi:hypothetical protein
MPQGAWKRDQRRLREGIEGNQDKNGKVTPAFPEHRPSSFATIAVALRWQRLKAAFVRRKKGGHAVTFYCGSRSVGKLFMLEGTAMPTPLTGDA